MTTKIDFLDGVLFGFYKARPPLPLELQTPGHSASSGYHRARLHVLGTQHK